MVKKAAMEPATPNKRNTRAARVTFREGIKMLSMGTGSHEVRVSAGLAFAMWRVQEREAELRGHC